MEELMPIGWLIVVLMVAILAASAHEWYRNNAQAQRPLMLRRFKVVAALVAVALIIGFITLMFA